ncbi:hypothetical protein LUCX_157 [Xanthomonas phage vB_XciM_LucasX]|nr:hypothetical protein LUCX_157 [Xanthomonas phage vB_XciM_LucasX]
MSNHKKYYDGLDKLTGQGMTPRVANDVLFLRTQSHHTPELEQKFIQESAKGEVPDITKFGK